MSLSENRFDNLYNECYNKYEENENSDKCMICYDNENLIKIGCGHYYHQSCLKTYFYNNKKLTYNCPYCNKINKFIKCKKCKSLNISNKCFDCETNKINTKDKSLNNLINKNNLISKQENDNNLTSELEYETKKILIKLGDLINICNNDCCQNIIKSGINKGNICGRVLKHNKCRYHK